MIRKLLLSTVVLGGFLTYSLYKNPDVISRLVQVPTPSATPVISDLSPTPTKRAISTPLAVPTPRGRYKDGVYTGLIADAFYGSLQVRATIIGGKITDIRFLQYPNSRQTSVEINARAMPLLEKEAVAVQSASVDGVTGATQTSRAFRESLSSALNQAI